MLTTGAILRTDYAQRPKWSHPTANESLDSPRQCHGQVSATSPKTHGLSAKGIVSCRGRVALIVAVIPNRRWDRPNPSWSFRGAKGDI